MLCSDSDASCSGDDIIQVEDGNMTVTAYGNGGDDKLIGARTIVAEALYGGDGNDKIWMAHPSL